MNFALIASIAAAIMVGKAQAWGDTLAHPVTGEIAQANLSPNGKALVAKLLDPTFNGVLGGQTANWADSWRSSHSNTAPWHYVDINNRPPGSCGYTPSDCQGRDCIVAAITDQTLALLNTQCSASTTNTQALQFLAHFLGDISQPLHNCARDTGGNSDKISYGGSSTNFHAIHDTQIPASRSQEVGATSITAYAQFLMKTYGSKKSTYTTSSFVDIKSVDSNNVYLAAINMANDANSLDCNQSAFWTLFDQDPSQDFSGAYYDATKLLLEEQIAKAGYRMAAWINAIADNCAGVVSTPTPSTTSATKTPVSTTTNVPVPTGTCTVSSGAYARKHNPFISFTDVSGNSARCAKIVTSSQLDTDASNNQLPQYMFYTPNLTNDGHDTDIPTASAWLKGFLEPKLTNAAYANTLFFITFDESASTSPNQVYAVLVGKGITGKGQTDSNTYNHYSWLATIEDLFNLGNLGRSDASANLIPINKGGVTVCPSSTTVPPPPTSTTATSYTLPSTNTSKTTSTTTTTASSCAHSICSTGAALTSSCDPCAAQVIAQDSYCGSTSWDSTCVGEVKSICGITCGSTITPTTSTTTKTSTTKTSTTTTATTSSCAHDICATGVALKSGCNACASQIISQDSYCGSTQWDSQCVSEVNSICGITC
ncbi:hypothetical protein HDU76_008301 [Blyttiomyces sp. JEL0837]|nr:hypothetical protein HDU76_008301 [Blyttiomyces sp. JEL0837]